MQFDFWVKVATEFIATALLIILGNGAVANVELKGTKGHQSGWLVIAIGYGIGVMMPALMFGNVSGNHINPAFTSLRLTVLTTFKRRIQTISWEHSQRFLAWIKELQNHVKQQPSMVSSTSLQDHSSFSLVHLP